MESFEPSRQRVWSDDFSDIVGAVLRKLRGR
jgi:hypothetical protein